MPRRSLLLAVLACALVAAGTALVAGLVAPALAVATGVGVAVGYGAHVAADACTPSGVALWAPFSRRRRWLLPARARIRTGSAREYLSLFLFVALLCVVGVPLLA